MPDHHGSGTNALLLTPPDAIAPAFGAGSFARHAARGAAAGARVRVAQAPSLELDVDTPGDLAALRGRSRACPERRAAHARGARPAGAALRARVTALAAEPLPGLPEIRPATTSRRCSRPPPRACPEPGLGPADVLVVAHKVVSKAEGRVGGSPT